MAKFVRKHKSTSGPSPTEPVAKKEPIIRGPRGGYERKVVKRLASKIAEIVPDHLFIDKATGPEDVGGKERNLHDAEVLRAEWAIKYPQMAPYRFMQDIKGYSENQSQSLIRIGGGLEEWHRERDRVLDKMTESVVKRHVDQLAEVNDQHVKSSKLGLARAVQMLTEGGQVVIDKESGLPRKDAMGRALMAPLKPADLVMCMSAIEKAQRIYRSAMGLPNDESGMAQLLEKVQINFNQTNNVQNNLNVTEPPKESPAAEQARLLTYDEISEFVEFRREQKKLRALEAKK